MEREREREREREGEERGRERNPVIRSGHKIAYRPPQVRELNFLRWNEAVCLAADESFLKSRQLAIGSAPKWSRQKTNCQYGLSRVFYGADIAVHQMYCMSQAEWQLRQWSATSTTTNDVITWCIDRTWEIHYGKINRILSDMKSVCFYHVNNEWCWAF